MTDILDVPAANDAGTDLVAPAKQILTIAQGMEITDEQMLEVATTELQRINARIKELNEERMSMTRPLDETKAKIIAKYKAPIELLQQADGVLRRSCSAWNAKVREEQRRAQEEADRIAREAAERLRREAAAAQAKADREAAELRERAAKAEAEGRAAEAARLAAKADSKVEAAEQKVQTLEVAAAAVPTTVAIAAPATAKGFSEATLYSAEVTDMALFARYCIATPMFANLICPNTKELNRMAVALKERFDMPGVKLVRTTSSRVRS